MVADLELNATLVAFFSIGMKRKRPREIPTGNFPDARNLFDEPPTPTPAYEDPVYHNEFHGGHDLRGWPSIQWRRDP